MPGAPTEWGTVLTTEVSSAAPGDLPTWVDISDHVKPSWDCAAGRQTELSHLEPGQATFVLLNDGRFTTGNPASIYPWFRQARRIRQRETVGYYTYELFDGYIQRPRGSHRIDEAAAASPQDATVSISAVDLRGRLGNARKFISTLGEHIRFNGGAALLGYWPCNDAGTSTLVASTTEAGPLRIVHTGAAGVDLAQFGQVAGPAGEDVSFLTLTPPTAGGTIALQGTTAAFVDFTVSAEVTLACWVRPSGTTVNSTIQARSDALTTSMLITASTTQWQLDVTTLAGSTSIAIAEPPTPDRWQFVSARLNNLTGAVNFYVDTSTTAGAIGAGSAGQLDTVVLQATGAQTGFGHLQVYGAAAGTWSQTVHLAQYQMGLTGLERQSTGARINTILDYAGIAPTARDIDLGVAVMSRATLAGRLPADVLDEAAETEQGRLFVQGGLMTFRDRHSVYDI